MREIKFRAWDKENEVFLRPEEVLVRAFNGQMVNWNKNVLFNVEIMQYTGIKDKKGVEIYEGDVVKAEYYSDMSMNPEIKLKDNQKLNTIKNFEVRWTQKTGFSPLDFFGWHGDREPIYEVIGNIYENKDLLIK